MGLLRDYMNPEKFPLTSQKGLSVDDQKLIDNFNYNQFLEALEEKQELDENQKARLQEYLEKKKLLEQLRQSTRQNPNEVLS